MHILRSAAAPAVDNDRHEAAEPVGGLNRIRERLGIDATHPSRLAATLPFSPGDATAGLENELQTVVVGSSQSADLPLTIRSSRYYRNMSRMADSGDVPRKSLDALDAYLYDNAEGVWEHSWVRFPIRCLSLYARQLFDRDLLADKKNDCRHLRKDCDRFTIKAGGETLLRVPVSYLLKIALADSVGAPEIRPDTRRIAESLYGHFLSDNTSPEITSFQPVAMGAGDCGAVAAETGKRFLLCQSLIQYANRKFGLTETGQRAMVYFAPQPPLRQQRLNDLISDALYRELFMSPCLSGWDRGEEKHAYMERCHKVLSRSQMHVLKKLKESGIVANNLVVLPNISNISLANNGTHLSLGSRLLSRSMCRPDNALQAGGEKYIGDLVIKVVEHFLPLFAGTYSAAPHRMDFRDFHPEKALGFLPHELNYTHLRLVWRQWKKKANLKVLSWALTPFGPEWLDRWAGRLLGLKGDLIPDSRLIDYLVCLMSTPHSSALDGRLGSDVELKKDLAALGVFDPAMPLYLLYRLRARDACGFSGFEGRHYSQFASLQADLGPAAALQRLVTALAFQYVMAGKTTHFHIPDDPRIESERRQFFFGAAIGVPAVYVERQTRNRFLQQVMARIPNVRGSRRRPAFLKIRIRDYLLALVALIREDGRELIDQLGMTGVIDDLEDRIRFPEDRSAFGRLNRGILDEAGAGSHLKLDGDTYKVAAERFYRHTLRTRHMEEAFDLLEGQAGRMDSWPAWRSGRLNRPLLELLNGRDARAFLESARREVLAETASTDLLRRLIHFTLLSIEDDRAFQTHP